jgi:hypothetical protein
MAVATRRTGSGAPLATAATARRAQHVANLECAELRDAKGGWVTGWEDHQKSQGRHDRRI